MQLVYQWYGLSGSSGATPRRRTGRCRGAGRHWGRPRPSPAAAPRGVRGPATVKVAGHLFPSTYGTRASADRRPAGQDVGELIPAARTATTALRSARLGAIAPTPQDDCFATPPCSGVGSMALPRNAAHPPAVLGLTAANACTSRSSSRSRVLAAVTICRGRAGSAGQAARRTGRCPSRSSATGRRAPRFGGGGDSLAGHDQPPRPPAR